MGLADFLGGKPSSLKSVEIPGLFSKEQGREFIQSAVGETRQPLRFDEILRQRFEERRQPSPFRERVTESLLSPEFGQDLSSSEQALIDQIFAQRQGTFNALGIGSAPGSQAAIAAAAAPTLVGLRQQEIGNLLGAEQQFSQTDLADIDRILGAQSVGLGSRQLDISTLLQAGKLGQTRLGTEQKGPTKGFLELAEGTLDLASRGAQAFGGKAF